LTEELKKAAAEKALELVQEGMLLGLGSGSTARYFTEGVGRLVAGGMKLRGVPTSRATAELAAANGITIVQELVGPIDVAVDGADEVDPGLNLIKGRGGAMSREKLVAAAAKRFVVVVDESKMVKPAWCWRAPGRGAAVSVAHHRRAVDRTGHEPDRARWGGDSLHHGQRQPDPRPDG